MAYAGSPLVIKQLDGFGGNFIDSNYLGASYETGKPHIFQDTLARIFSSNNRFFTGKPLLGMTNAKGPYGTMDIDKEIYRWFIQGADYKCAVSVENVETSPTPGINKTEFRIKLDLDYYAAPDVLFGEHNNYPIEIVGGPIQEGNGYVYTCRLQTDDMSFYLPATYLEEGREFSKAWTTVSSEFNEEFGTQQYPSSLTLESQLSYFAEKQTVTDKAWRTQGQLGIKFLYKDPNTGKDIMPDKFLPYAEAVMYDTFHMGMEVQMTLGKKSTSAGKKGYWKKTGPGIREILKDSWIDVYSGSLTVNRLKDYLMQIFFTRVDQGDRNIVAMTGEYGSSMFHDMLAAEAASFLTVDSNFTRVLEQNPRHLAFGAQFTAYQGPNGMYVTLVNNPLYDSLQWCKQTHPQYPGVPVDSFRFTFLDFGANGMENGKAVNNIMMLREKDSYTWGNKPGMIGPSGPIKGGILGDLIQGYQVAMQGSAGIWMKDASRGGELIFDTNS